MIQWVQKHYLALWVTLHLMKSHNSGDLTIGSTSWQLPTSLRDRAAKALTALKALSPIGLFECCQLLNIPQAATVTVSRDEFDPEAPPEYLRCVEAAFADTTEELFNLTPSHPCAIDLKQILQRRFSERADAILATQATRRTAENGLSPAIIERVQMGLHAQSMFSPRPVLIAANQLTLNQAIAAEDGHAEARKREADLRAAADWVFPQSTPRADGVCTPISDAQARAAQNRKKRKMRSQGLSGPQTGSQLGHRGGGTSDDATQEHGAAGVGNETAEVARPESEEAVKLRAAIDVYSRTVQGQPGALPNDLTDTNFYDTWNIPQLKPMMPLVEAFACVPGTSVPDERLFSRMSAIINDQRHSLKPAQAETYALCGSNKELWQSVNLTRVVASKGFEQLCEKLGLTEEAE